MPAELRRWGIGHNFAQAPLLVHQSILYTKATISQSIQSTQITPETDAETRHFPSASSPSVYNLLSRVPRLHQALLCSHHPEQPPWQDPTRPREAPNALDLPHDRPRDRLRDNGSARVLVLVSHKPTVKLHGSAN